MLDEVSLTTGLLAAYTYYRSLQAIPSLIREWWETCKNLQLSSNVAAFTIKHFSPILIVGELAHLRNGGDERLRDENMTVKIATGANEIKAVYVVDEQAMEIAIRLPPEYPLHGVEIRDVRKVGIPEAKWRAWILAMQQVITMQVRRDIAYYAGPISNRLCQNGLIADALGLFKRNVSLHFEGVEACAICYSIISVTDRSLPTKNCRTCNNAFHGGCLFKVRALVVYACISYILPYSGSQPVTAHHVLSVEVCSKSLCMLQVQGTHCVASVEARTKNGPTTQHWTLLNVSACKREP